MSGRDFFRLSGLKPLILPTKDGHCECSPTEISPLYSRGVGKGITFRCDVCHAMSQSYEQPPPKKPNRLVGSYLLITTASVHFWGENRLDLRNPAIKMHSAKGQMAGVIRDLILNPPVPPWLFIEYAQAQVTAADLIVVEDNRRISFSGKNSHAINRDQLLQMQQSGLSPAEWEEYINAFPPTNMKMQNVCEQIRRKFPHLIEIDVPLPGSWEHQKLKQVMKSHKETAT